jgi:uncharacterized protein
LLAALIFFTAVAYSAVGQAGASGYLAAMGLVGIDPSIMKPTALALNLIVASIGTVQFWRAKQFSWRSFYPFGVLGFPFSLLGGAVHLPATAYYPVVGALLLLSSLLMIRAALAKPIAPKPISHAPPLVAALAVGAIIGFVSGVTGTGGGVFLAPIILSFRWIEVREAAAVTAAYNLLNSGAALASATATLPALPPTFALWGALAAVGAVIGSTVGSRFLPDHALRYLLAAVLAISGLKLVFN